MCEKGVFVFLAQASAYRLFTLKSKPPSFVRADSLDFTYELLAQMWLIMWMLQMIKLNAQGIVHLTHGTILCVSQSSKLK